MWVAVVTCQYHPTGIDKWPDLNWNVISEPRESKGGDVGGTQNSCGVVLWVRVLCLKERGMQYGVFVPLFSSF